MSQRRQRLLLSALADAQEAGLTRSQMAKLLDGSIRAVERALTALQRDGAVVMSAIPPDGSRHKRFVLTTPPVYALGLTPQSQLAQHVAEASLLRTGGGAWLDLHPAKTFVTLDGIGPKGTQRLARVTDRTAVHGTGHSPLDLDSTVLTSLIAALSEPVPPMLELGYRAVGRNSDRVHHVVPYTLLQDAFANGTYLVAWDHIHQRVVIYRISRMKSVRVIRPAGLSGSAREALYRAVEFQLGAWTNTDEPAEVRVRITGIRWVSHLMDVLPDLPKAKVDPDPDDREAILVTFWAAAHEGALRWVLQMGAAAEVLEPPILREAVAEELKRAAQHYRKATTSAHIRPVRR